MKGIVMLLVMALVIWGLWMSYEWLVNRDKNKEKRLREEADEFNNKDKS